MGEIEVSVPELKDGEVVLDSGYPRKIDLENTTKNYNKKGRSLFVDNVLRTNKYPNWCVFLPMNLFEQYMKAANIFFLLIVIMASIPTISAFSPWSTVLAIVFILGVQASKDAYEDYHRIKADNKANALPACVWKEGGTGGAWAETTWAEIEVGDLIKIKADESVPADTLILASRSVDPKKTSGTIKEQGQVMVDTANLDGETNLKIQQANPRTTGFYKNPTRDNLQDICKLSMIQTEGPAKNLEELKGQLDFEKGVSERLNIKNFLLRGVTVRQTYEVYGVVVYTGSETRIVQNSDGEAPKKRTRMDKLLNQCVLFCFVFTFAVCLGMCIGMGYWCHEAGADHWYLLLYSSSIHDGLGYFNPDDPWLVGLLGFFTWVQLMCYVIPIPLYVTVEMIKLFMGNFIDWDIQMYSEEINRCAKCRNSSVPEELGQVQYVLSDKTGTLTQNKMELLKFSAGGLKYGFGKTEIEQARHQLQHPDAPPLVDESLNKPHSNLPHEDPGFRFWDPRVSGFGFVGADEEEAVREFLLGLALAHEVMAETKEDGSIKYNAASPDDAALVVGAKNLGYRLLSCENKPNSGDGIEGKVMKVSIVGHDEGGNFVHSPADFVLLHTIEFNSDRKRMSNIFLMPEGHIRIYMKGADNFIYDRLTEEHKASLAMNTTMANICTFGNDGLRTLLYSYKDVPYETFALWDTKWKEALLIVDEAEQGPILEELAKEMEEGHTPLGASAIEDKLQENVGDTITHLSEAGIQTWVLTGDKTNTAIMIGFATCLLKNSMERVVFKEDKEHERRDLDPPPRAADAGERIAKAMVEARAYYLKGEKHCPTMGKVMTGTKWYRKNVEWTDDGPAARYQDISQEAYSQLKEEDRWMRCVDERGKKELENEDGSPMMKEAYVLFDPVEHYNTSNLAMVIEGMALQQIGIGVKESPIVLTEPGACQEMFGSRGSMSEEQEQEYLEGLPRAERWSVQFTNFAQMCKAVVACRVSPSQKAEVTKCVKKYLKKTTLCIGDGANDVPMILAAHVGVGIAGVEGSQAVNNADFALCKFRDLERIVLVHGRWAYKRLGYVCIYILYKNIAFCCIFAINAYFSGYSGQLFYDDWVLASYNVIFSAFPVFAYGFLEQDVDSQVSLAFPISYRPGQTDAVLNFQLFIRWTVEAIWHATVIFIMVFNILGFRPMHNGQDFSIWDAGNACFTANLLVVTFRIAMDTQHFTCYHHIAYWGSLVSWFMFITVYCWVPPGMFGKWDTEDNMYFSSLKLFQAILFYVTQLVTVALCLLPTFVLNAWEVVMTPTIRIPVARYSWRPDPLSDNSIMWHLRHYMKKPAKYCFGQSAHRMSLTSEEMAAAALRKEEKKRRSSVRLDRWSASYHSGAASGDTRGSGDASVLDVHLGKTHVHTGERCESSVGDYVCSQPQPNRAKSLPSVQGGSTKEFIVSDNASNIEVNKTTGNI